MKLSTALLAFVFAILIAGCVPKGFTRQRITGPFVLDTTRNLEARNVGPIINTKAAEYAPAIAPDGLTLYYVVDHGTVEQSDADGWFSDKAIPEATLFELPQKLDPT